MLFPEKKQRSRRAAYGAEIFSFSFPIITDQYVVLLYENMKRNLNFGKKIKLYTLEVKEHVGNPGIFRIKQSVQGIM